MTVPAKTQPATAGNAKGIKLAIAGGCLLLAAGFMVWQLMPAPIATPAARSSDPEPAAQPTAKAVKTKTDGAPRPEDPQTPAPPSANTTADPPRGNYRVAPK